uniref:Cytochrome P450 n=1 Tax=Timema monikensis TaxID=170555 RepID=A0A7R9HL82_9NEOP|nr:unnamed protein product [Timema monikensis]
MAIYFSSVLEDTVLIFSSVCLFLYWYFTSTYNFWKKKGVPFLKPKFFWGNSKNTILRKTSLYDHIIFLYNQFPNKKMAGIYQIRNPVLLLRDPDLIRQVLIKDFDSFQDRNFPVNEKTDPLSCHLFALRGEKWRKLRVKLTPTFTSGKIKIMFDLMKVCASDLSSYLEVAETLGISFIPKDVTKFFLRVVKDVVDYREKNSIVRKDFLQLLIELKGKRNVSSENHSNDHKDLKTDDNIELTDSLLAAQCFVFFVAGFETSSTTIGFALYELAVNPEIQDRASAEVVSVLQGNGGEMTYEAVNKMEYLGRVLDETLRKYPVVPVLSRNCTKPCTIQGTDLLVDKGMKVLIPVVGLHMDPKYYPDPLRFDPGRFSEKNQKARPHFTYLPFGEGPRICIGITSSNLIGHLIGQPDEYLGCPYTRLGLNPDLLVKWATLQESRVYTRMRFGLLQSKLGLATLLCKYRFSPCEDTSTPLKMDPRAIFASPDGGVPLRIQQRN